MRKVRNFALLLIILFIATYYYREHVAEKKILRIGMECDYVPHNWEEFKSSESNMPLANVTGSYVEGYDVQIAKRIAEELNMTPEFRKIPWNDLIEALNTGEIDVILSGMLDTEDRRELIAFSDTYEIIKTEYTIFIDTGGKYADASSFADLAGARIVAQKGTKHDEVVDQIPDVIHIEPAETITEALNMILEGNADGMVMDLDAAVLYETAYKTLSIIRFSEGEGFVLNFRGVCAGVRKRDTKLLNEINNAIGNISKRERRRLMDRTISRLWRNLS